MPGSARILATGELRHLLAHVAQTRHPLRDRCIVLLSFKAALRACEIAGLDWVMVTPASRSCPGSIMIERRISKSGRKRQIPLHPQLSQALKELHASHGCPQRGPVIRSERGQGPMTPASVVNWFGATYAKLGMAGCSSHSGRRTFITRAARMLPKSGGSLRDIQELAGHRSLAMTSIYIEGQSTLQRKLVSLL